MRADPDLGALCARLTQRLIEAERPLLDAHGLTMWQYVALSRLAAKPVRTQLELARAIGYDKTRLIALLDGLTSAGWVERRPDPRDRRAHVVALTPAGEAKVAATRTDIRAMEDALLDGYTAAQQRILREMLSALAGLDDD